MTDEQAYALLAVLEIEENELIARDEDKDDE